MRTAKQPSLFDYSQNTQTRKRYGRTSHGGANSTGHRKLERPLSTSKWIHLVLKSEKAKGSMSFLSLRHRIFIDTLIKQKARRFGIKVADYANVGNHLHLKIKMSSRKNFQKFLKSIATQIARQVTGACRGKPFGKFWQGLAFTRVLCSARESLLLKGYIAANREEAVGGKPARDQFLRQFNQWVYRERLRTKMLPLISMV